MKLKKHEIDGANKDKKEKIFTKNFQLELFFDGQEPAPLSLREDGITLEQEDLYLIKVDSTEQLKDGRFVLARPDIGFCVDNEDNIDCVNVSIKALRAIVMILKNECGESVLTSEISKKIKNKQEYKEFLEILKEYQLITFNYMSNVNLSVFWLNTFHVMMIHSLIEYNPRSIEERNFMFKTSTYYINGNFYCLLQVIESIIRCSLTPSLAHFPECARFNDKDERLNNVLLADPRLNLCLSLLHTSSPPLRLFTIKDFERQIQECTTFFLDKHVTIQLDSKKITLGGYLASFSQDFGKNDKEIIEFLKKHMSTKESENLNDSFSIVLEKDSHAWDKYSIDEFPSDYILSKQFTIMERNSENPTVVNNHKDIQELTPTEIDDDESTTEDD